MRGFYVHPNRPQNNEFVAGEDSHFTARYLFSCVAPFPTFLFSKNIWGFSRLMAEWPDSRLAAVITAARRQMERQRATGQRPHYLLLDDKAAKTHPLNYFPTALER